jgi:hypothetical protein
MYPDDLLVAQTRLRELAHSAFELRGEPFSRETQIGRGQASHRLSLTTYRLKAEEQERHCGTDDRQQVQQDSPPVRRAVGASLGALSTHGRDMFSRKTQISLSRAF